MLNWLLDKLQKRAQTLTARQHELNGNAMPASRIDELVREGYAFHTAGELDRAEASYRKILFREPKHADVLFLLGEIRSAKGDYEQAISLIRKAIEANPGISAFHASLAGIYRQMQDLSNSEACWREAIQIEEGNFEYLNDLGSVYRAQQRYEEALSCFDRALALNPELHQALFNKGGVLRSQERLEESAETFERGLAIEPKAYLAYLELAGVYLAQGKKDQALACYQKAFSGEDRLDITPEQELNAYFEWGNILLDKRQTQEAIKQFRRALDIDRTVFGVWVNLGDVYREDKQYEESIDCFLEAIRLAPSCAQAFGNLGITLKEMGDCTRARGVYREITQIITDKPWPEVDAEDPYCELDIAFQLNQYALSLDPGLADFNINLGVVYEELGQFDKALECYQHALKAGAEGPFVHFNMGISLLRFGQFEAGWDEYEARMKLGKNINLATLAAAPLWQGESLTDSTLLVHAEQGLGDTIQFARYLKAVKERCSRVIIECQPAVKSLIESMPDTKNVYAAGSPLPKFDYQVPMLSLPRIFGTRLENIPSEIPYIFADPQRAEQWHQEISNYVGLNVGIVWAGGVVHTGNRFRSCSLAVFAPLAEVSGVNFFSLQKGGPEQEAQSPPAGMHLINSSDRIHDFLDTAALIANLDLVITVDTSVAHLAGAMGKKVWVLVPFCPDWRWMLERNDSPWYPSMRLFRQEKIGQWDAAISQMKGDLAHLAG